MLWALLFIALDLAVRALAAALWWRFYSPERKRRIWAKWLIKNLVAYNDRPHAPPSESEQAMGIAWCRGLVYIHEDSKPRKYELSPKGAELVGLCYEHGRPP